MTDDEIAKAKAWVDAGTNECAAYAIHSLRASLAECIRARAEAAALRAAMGPPLSPKLLPPERVAEIRERHATACNRSGFYADVVEGGRLVDSTTIAMRDLMTHAETLESLLRDLGGEPAAIREAGRREGMADAARLLEMVADHRGHGAHASCVRTAAGLVSRAPV